MSSRDGERSRSAIERIQATVQDRLPQLGNLALEPSDDAGELVQLVRTASPRRAAAAQLVEMGFPMHAAIQALQQADPTDDMRSAVELLLAGEVAIASTPPQSEPESALSASANGIQGQRANSNSSFLGESVQNDDSVCAICFCEIEANQMKWREELSVSADCVHNFHRECFSQYLTTTKFEVENEYLDITCPSCDRQVGPAEIEVAVGGADTVTWKQYLRLSANAKVDRDPNQRWCPAPGCGTPIVGWVPDPAPRTILWHALLATRSAVVALALVPLSRRFLRAFLQHVHVGIGNRLQKQTVLSGSRMLLFAGAGMCGYGLGWAVDLARIESGKRSTCKRCGTSICFDCNRSWHGGLTRCDEIEDTALTNWSKKADFGRCPKCKAPIERNKGCNHMTCAACKHEFCWLCGADYDGGRHFRGLSTCPRFGGVSTREISGGKWLVAALSMPLALLVVAELSATGLSVVAAKDLWMKIGRLSQRRWHRLISWAISIPWGLCVVRFDTGNLFGEFLRSNHVGVSGLLADTGMHGRWRQLGTATQIGFASAVRLLRILIAWFPLGILNPIWYKSFAFILSYPAALSAYIAPQRWPSKICVLGAAAAEIVALIFMRDRRRRRRRLKSVQLVIVLSLFIVFGNAIWGAVLGLVLALPVVIHTACIDIMMHHHRLLSSEARQGIVRGQLHQGYATAVLLGAFVRATFMLSSACNHVMLLSSRQSISGGVAQAFGVHAASAPLVVFFLSSAVATSIWQFQIRPRGAIGIVTSWAPFILVTPVAYGMIPRHRLLGKLMLLAGVWLKSRSIVARITQRMYGRRRTRQSGRNSLVLACSIISTVTVHQLIRGAMAPTARSLLVFRMAALASLESLVLAFRGRLRQFVL
eukprot:SAG31_NODE_2727_length_5181_cov_7.977568_2_plen_877_part_00